MCVFARGSSDEAFLLEPGKSRGTAGYMSPEHAKGKPLDKRTVRRNVLRLMPSLTIPRSYLNAGIDIMLDVFAQRSVSVGP